MSIQPTTVQHTTSFDVYDSVTGVNEATREIFDNIAFENINEFEGFMYRNTFIASNNFTGGMNERVNPMQTTMNNPAGSFRSLLTPKGNTGTFKPIEGLGDIKFKQFANDTISLSIDTYMDSGNPTLIYPVDSGSGWLVSDIEGAAQGQAISSLVRFINYKIYRTMKEGVLAQIDPFLGAQGRVKQSATGLNSDKAFTEDFIDDIANMIALPHDRYITGTIEDEIAVAITPTGSAKLLKEKLILYDGQFMGYEGKFFNGLPYTHRFAGVPVKKTKYMNDGEVADFDYVGLIRGKYSPFLFHLARFSGRAEQVIMTDGAIGIYGTNLHGMKIEEKLDQYMFARTVEIPVANYTVNLVGLKVTTLNSAGEIKVEWNTTDTTSVAVLQRVTKENSPATGAWTAVAASGDTIATDAAGGALETRVNYRVEIASSADGTTPENGITNARPFVILKTVTVI